ncbi:glycosyltransferase [Mycolicibacterium elephantis]|uniref:glycosyltransferase n=1 Tax=Mycolicibacterium elephantis TaxID=81858 RepID=UPI000629110C|nr:glycosyltransferase [Mycolicibacterium elephantis]KKW65751.1 glycosyl transferase family 1 [Mycolicibacterium elephantis]
MKFVLAFYGTRGDVEPGVAVGRELVRRGHDVCMAVSPDLVGFTEAAGPAAVACGPDVRVWQDVNRDFWARFLRKFWRNFWRIGDLKDLLREDWRLLAQCWDDVNTTLTSLAKDADLLFTGVLGEEAAGNVAERYGVPFATLHVFPIRANGQLVPGLPARVGRSIMKTSEWLGWPLMKRLEDPQRRELGLPKATGPSPWRLAERGVLEIQAYDSVCFPGLADEWAQFDGRRPFVGALTMELPGEADDEVASWIAAGTPPICFGFGSMPVESAADTLAMISGACAQLGERALVCAGSSDFSHVPHFDNVKVVGTMNYSAAFPACRAVVHHGGAGTTAASLRAGVPTLVLSTDLDQTLWGARVKKLGVGTTRRLSATTEKSLVADLRKILEPQYRARAREVRAEMTQPADSVAAAADLLEAFARVKDAA